MNDPHVEELHYKLIIPESIDYRKAPPFEHNTDKFSIRLSGETAVVKMHEQFPTVESARNEVEEVLREWEVAAFLQRGMRALEFKFDKPKIIDRKPSKSGEQSIEVHSTFHAVVDASASVHASIAKFPEPRPNFEISPVVEQMFTVYRQFKEGRCPLAPMAYLCLTILKLAVGGDRSKISSWLNVSHQVVNNLARLSSEKGGSEGRKAEALDRPYIGNERSWLEEVVKALIYRVGEIEGNPKVAYPKLTMNDFPSLP